MFFFFMIFFHMFSSVNANIIFNIPNKYIFTSIISSSLPYIYIYISSRTHDTLSATAFVAKLAKCRTRIAGSSILTESFGVAFFATGLS